MAIILLQTSGQKVGQAVKGRHSTQRQRQRFDWYVVVIQYADFTHTIFSYFKV